MDNLRWILLVIGVLLIAAVYFTGRRKEQGDVRRREPGFDDFAETTVERDDGFSADEAEDYETDDEADFAADPDEDVFDFEHLLADGTDHAPPVLKARSNESHYSMLLEDEFVVIHAMAPEGSRLAGARLYATLDELGFELEADGIFHYQQSQFPLVVVNMFKPGTFPQDADVYTARGISFILRLSKSSDPLDAFDEMVTIAYELKSSLNMQLFDVQRSSLTRQTVSFLEEEIADFQRGLGL